MTPENNAKLRAEFPDLYLDLRWGFECGDGWFELIYDLSAKLVTYPDVRALQVKEKFGGLRFYAYGLTSSSSELIKEAEAQSFLTCDVCGEVGKCGDVGGGFYATRCAKHATEEERL